MRKKFIRSLLVFLAPLIAIAFTADLLLRHIPNDYSYKNGYLHKYSDSIQVLLLGSSHGFYDIDPKYIRARCFNAAYVSQSLDYDDAILEKYTWRNLHYILVPVSYFSIYSDLSTTREAWRAKDYAMYYRLPAARSPVDYTEIFSNRLDINWKRISSYYLSHTSEISCTDLGWGTKCTSSDDQDLNESALEALVRHTVPRDEEVVSRNEAVLKRMILFARRRNIRVILYTPPAYRTYTDRLDKAQWTATMQVATGDAATYANTCYLNFLEDPRFTEADFHDADHLNERGAEKFTRLMDEAIRPGT